MSSNKLYCYVDETGQDTTGRLFIVATIIVEKDKEDTLSNLEKIERTSGKQKRKWINTRQAERDKYLQSALHASNIMGRIYFRVFNNSGTAYEDLTVLVIGQALNLYIEKNKITDYKATVVVDGLSRTAQKRMAKSLRELGVKARKVRGERDESNALLRLSDSVAGLARDDVKLVEKFTKEGIINEL